MAIGNMLAGSDQQYIALKDETGTWRILDTWHDDLKHLDVEDEVPDNSEAVVVFSEGQFIALVKEAGRLGILENATLGTGGAELEAEILDKAQTIKELNDQIGNLKSETNKLPQKAAHSEEYDLKEMALTSILKLVSMQDMANLSKD